MLTILYDASRLVADLENLFPMTILPKTPPIVPIILFLIVVVYAIFGGIEILGRLGELFFTVILIFNNIFFRINSNF
jgi:spore germination protein KB